MTEDSARRAQAIELLEANHTFPGDYTFSVIALNAEETAAAVLAAVEEVMACPVGADAHERRPSAHGKYVSHRLTVRCADAQQVLAVYARVRAVPGVISLL